MKRGFTLLEVMIAIAILGLSLTAIFSSEVGAMNVAHRARKTNVATLLARCKMAELEELVAKEGLPAIEKMGTDGCCEDAEVEGFECDWEIVRIVLPELDAFSEDEFDEETDAITDDVGSADQYLAGGGDDLAGLAMELAYPVLKPSIEEQVRRVTVKVRWSEGVREPSFDVVQFLVAEQGAAQDEEAEGDEERTGAAQ